MSAVWLSDSSFVRTAVVQEPVGIRTCKWFNATCCTVPIQQRKAVGSFYSVGSDMVSCRSLLESTEWVYFSNFLHDYPLVIKHIIMYRWFSPTILDCRCCFMGDFPLPCLITRGYSLDSQSLNLWNLLIFLGWKPRHMCIPGTQYSV
jgi:hypothetical protein